MQLNIDNTSSIQIKSYQNGVICINDTLYKNSVIVTPNQIIEPWGPQSIDDFTTEHLQVILQLSPELVIIGSGEQQKFLPATRLRPLIEQKIGVEIMTTPAACRTFNLLAAENRNVVAAIIVK